MTTTTTAASVTITGRPGSLLSDAKALTVMAWQIDRRRFMAQVVFLVVGGFVGGVNLLLLIPIVNSVAGQGGQSISLPLLGEVNLASAPLWLLLAGFVLVAAVAAIIQRAGSINAAAFQPQIVDELRRQAFDAVMAADWTFVLKRRKSDVIAIIASGASRCGMAFQQLLTASVNVVLFVATAIVALLVSPAVAALALLGVLGLFLVQLSAVRPVHQLGRELGSKTRGLQAVMQDSLDSLRLVRAHDSAEPWMSQLTGALADTREVQVANASRQATVTAFSSVVLAAAASVLVFVSVSLEVSPTSIVVILLLVARLARLAQTLGKTIAQLANSLPAVEDIATLTSQAREAVESPYDASTRTSVETHPDRPLLEFESVTYTYPDSDNGVHGISFDVPRGRITVLTGPSGSGKSTTADLSLGLLAPESGRVLVDGEELTREDLRWWRSHVAYVPQETVLIPSSLRSNLTWSIPGGATDEQCWRALDQAQATFARDLPQGLDTVLGDRGVRLSGGERQRVAIARALLRDPALLVLDEATSSLDDATESAVLRLVETLVPAVTLLVIAHRQSTIDAADHLVRFHDGRITEGGLNEQVPQTDRR